MTDAYIEGFCKTAKEHGVDPEALMKYANPMAMLRAVPKAFSAAKAMRAAANLGWSAPKALSRQGLGHSVLKNISVLGQRADKADKLRTADSLYNKATSVARDAGSRPQPTSVSPDRYAADGAILLKQAPKGPLAKRTSRLREFIQRAFPGYDAGF